MLRLTFAWWLIAVVLGGCMMQALQMADSLINTVNGQ